MSAIQSRTTPHDFHKGTKPDRWGKGVMYLESSIVVRRSPHEVWAFLADPRNLILWDRSVARVEVASSTPAGIGFRFDTLAPLPPAPGSAVRPKSPSTSLAIMCGSI